GLPMPRGMSHSGRRVCWAGPRLEPDPATSRRHPGDRKGGTMESMSIDDSLQLNWLTHLVGARSPAEVAAAIAALARDRPGCEAASVLWRLHDRAGVCSMPAVLVLRLQPAWAGPRFLDEMAALLRPARLHLQRALEWLELQHSHEQLE